MAKDALLHTSRKEPPFPVWRVVESEGSFSLRSGICDGVDRASKTAHIRWGQREGFGFPLYHRIGAAYAFPLVGTTEIAAIECLIAVEEHGLRLSIESINKQKDAIKALRKMLKGK